MVDVFYIPSGQSPAGFSTPKEAEGQAGRNPALGFSHDNGMYPIGGQIVSQEENRDR